MGFGIINIEENTRIVFSSYVERGRILSNFTLQEEIICILNNISFDKIIYCWIKSKSRSNKNMKIRGVS